MSVWLGGVGLVALGQLFEVSFVVGILVMGSVICSRAPTWARELSEDFRRVWDVAQYALFGLIGYAVELGPLREVGLAVVIIVLAGQLGRALAAWLATAGANRTPRERSACVLSYIPKATIQAAFAALPLDRGLPEGNVVLGAAIVAILITAPAGVIAITRGVPRLLAND
jgi:Kef-type K+ transport system membrane component KefB